MFTLHPVDAINLSNATINSSRPHVLAFKTCHTLGLELKSLSPSEFDLKLITNWNVPDESCLKIRFN